MGGGCLTLEHNGSDTILIACSPPGAQRWNCLWSPRVKVVIPLVPETMAFHMH